MSGNVPQVVEGFYVSVNCIMYYFRVFCLFVCFIANLFRKYMLFILYLRVLKVDLVTTSSEVIMA